MYVTMNPKHVYSVEVRMFNRIYQLKTRRPPQINEAQKCP